MDPKTDESKIEKKLEKLDIVHYSVLLQTIIQSRLDSVKTIITLSSVAIGFLFTAGKFVGLVGITGMIVCGISVLSFLVAIGSGVFFLNQASTKYEGELMKAENMNDKQWNNLIEARKKFSVYRKTALCTFVIGIVAGVAFGVLLTITYNR